VILNKIGFAVDPADKFVIRDILVSSDPKGLPVWFCILWDVFGLIAILDFTNFDKICTCLAISSSATSLLRFWIREIAIFSAGFTLRGYLFFNWCYIDKDLSLSRWNRLFYIIEVLISQTSKS
jgi:hypothetical protein